VVDLSYNPTFHHDVWVDRQDRVLAEGSNGFNVRFEGIEGDLLQASKVVRLIDRALAEATGPPTGSVQEALTLTPPLFLPNAVGVPIGEVNEFAQGDSGTVNLSLPHGVHLQNLRAVIDIGGGEGSATFTMSLARLPLHLTIPPPSVQTLATVSRTGGGFGPIEHVAIDGAVSASLAVVDLTTFRYVLTASFAGQSISPVTVAINSVQIQYST
jgi:hypothetical protein